MVDPGSLRLTRRQALHAGCMTFAGAFLAASTTITTTATAQARTMRVGTFRQNHVSAPLYWPKFAPAGVKVEVTTFGSGQ